jgi:hypothetical protein
VLHTKTRASRLICPWRSSVSSFLESPPLILHSTHLKKPSQTINPAKNASGTVLIYQVKQKNLTETALANGTLGKRPNGQAVP